MAVCALSPGMTSAVAVQQTSQGKPARKESGVKVPPVPKPPPAWMSRQAMSVSAERSFLADRLLLVSVPTYAVAIGRRESKAETELA